MYFRKAPTVEAEFSKSVVFGFRFCLISIYAREAKVWYNVRECIFEKKLEERRMSDNPGISHPDKSAEQTQKTARGADRCRFRSRQNTIIP